MMDEPSVRVDEQTKTRETSSLLICTYEASPCGPSVRVGEPATPRNNTHPKAITLRLFVATRSTRGRNASPTLPVGTWKKGKMKAAGVMFLVPSPRPRVDGQMSRRTRFDRRPRVMERAKPCLLRHCGGLKAHTLTNPCLLRHCVRLKAHTLTKPCAVFLLRYLATMLGSKPTSSRARTSASSAPARERGVN